MFSNTALMTAAAGNESVLSLIVSICYVLAAVIRLSYYNSIEIENGAPTKFFYGMPVTLVSIIAALVYCVSLIFSISSAWMHCAILFVSSLLFLLKVKIKKASVGGRLILSAFGLFIFVYLLLATI